MKFIVEWFIYTICCIAFGGVLTLVMLQQYILPTAEIDIEMIEVNKARIQMSIKDLTGVYETPIIDRDVYVIWNMPKKTAPMWKNYCMLPDNRDFKKDSE